MKDVLIKWSTRTLMAIVALACASHPARAISTAHFEDLPLDPGGYWNGSDRSGDFQAGRLQFNNTYSGSWAGWAYSNTTDTTTGNHTNQYSAIPGGGLYGSANYGVAYSAEAGGFPGGTVPLISEIPAGGIPGAFFTNTTYAYWSMAQGDQFGRKFSRAGNDWYKLTIVGLDSSGQALPDPGNPQRGLEVDFYLADFRSPALREPGAREGNYIVDAWTRVDLSSLSEARTLKFELESSDTGDWGMNTPAYFAMDMPNSLAWDEQGDGNWDPSSQWLGGFPGDVPDVYTHTTVSTDTVTVDGDGRALSLEVDDGGTLQVGPAGRVEVADDLVFDDAQYAAGLDGAGAARARAAGGIELAGDTALRIEALGGLDTVGHASRTILEAVDGAALEGTFAHQPAPHDHLGYGVFYRDISYAGDAVSVDLFQAAAGDANGDGYFNFADLIQIFSLGGFAYGDGDNDNSDWLSGDFSGDADFSFDDLVAAFSQNGSHYGSGQPYLPAADAMQSARVSTIPEPSSLLLLALAAVVALAFRRQSICNP